MLNKRVGTLLALVLVSSMALSGPAAVMAASGNSGGTSQTETREDKEEKKEEFEEKADDAKADAKEDKNNADKDRAPGKQADLDAVDEAEEEEKSLPRTEKEDEDKSSPRESVSKDDSASDNDKDNNSPSANKTGPFTVDEEAIEGTDYNYDENKDQLTIKSNKSMTISGTVSSGSLVVDSAQGANLTFNNLHMNGSGTVLQIEKDTGAVQIHLSGKNEFKGAIQIDSGKQVKIYGPGVLLANGVQSLSTNAVVISGGNIQASFTPQPENGGKVPVYPVSVNNLTGNKSCSINQLQVGTTNYSYGSSVVADSDGKVVMYLPAGEVRVALNDVDYVGTVTSDGTGELKPDESSEPTGSPSPSATNTPTQAPSDPTKPPVTVTATPSGEQPDTANALNNKIFWINSEATYRSGANLQFYATGAGYNPEEPQQTNPVKNSTRYVPVSWSVVGNDNQSAASGKWKEKNREFAGGGTSSSNGQYVPAEYRFKGSFVISTNQASSVPYTLKVDYQQQKYNGKKWQKTNGAVNTQSVRFYIRNTDLGTVSPTPRSTYYSNRLTSTATRRDVSSNARNARTSDDTPIGTMIFLMFAAAGSGAVIFRRKNRS